MVLSANRIHCSRFFCILLAYFCMSTFAFALSFSEVGWSMTANLQYHPSTVNFVLEIPE